MAHEKSRSKFLKMPYPGEGTFVALRGLPDFASRAKWEGDLQELHSMSKWTQAFTTVSHEGFRLNLK